MIRVLFFVALYFVADAGAAARIRVQRYLQIDDQLYELVFYSRTRVTDHPSFEEVAVMGLNGFDDEALRGELLLDEDWKFEYFDWIEYISKEKDAALIGSIRSMEGLLEHDEIVVLRKFKKQNGVWGRETVGILATKFQLPGKEKLLFQDRQSIEISPSPTADLDPRTPFLPYHWNSYRRYVGYQNRRWGGYLQINSLVTDKRHQVRYLNYLLGGAYWHGLFTNGPVVQPGETYLGETVTQSTVYVPLYYLLEGYGTRNELWKRWDMQPLNVGGSFSFSDRFQPEKKLSIMGVGAASYWPAVQEYLKAKPGLPPAFQRGYRISRLSVVPPHFFQIRLPGLVRIDETAERAIQSCIFQLLIESRPTAEWFPFSGFSPELHLNR